jgi:NTP pyrophosphatase (non-canonical NTP hydrolase)
MNSLNETAQKCMETSKKNGFVTTKENMLGKLMLVVTELAEAAEDVRHESWEHFGEELADTMIRVMDIAANMRVDLEFEIDRKMKINEDRTYLHGTKSTV